MKKQIRAIKERYQNIIMPLALVGGFILDIFTLNQIDQTFDNALLIFHLCVTGTTIAILFSQGTSLGNKILNEKIIYRLQTVMVFSFGALFSGFVIFYTRSGSLLTSWPFIVAMLVLMLGTEFKKKYFYRLRLQIIIFAVAIVSWSIFFVPVVIKKMGSWVFLLSTLVSIILVTLFLLLLKIINKKRLKKHLKKIILNIISIIIVFNILYFTNIIPPIPLSLKYKAVYYEVTKNYPGYQAQYEKTPWYNFFQKRSTNMYWKEGEDIFVFTQIFAPTNLETIIHHDWEYFNEQTRRWEKRTTIKLQITGGRKDGYRGFSKKTNLEYGTWRVRAKSNDNKTIGSVRFDIEPYGPAIRELVIEEL